MLCKNMVLSLKGRGSFWHVEHTDTKEHITFRGYTRIQTNATRQNGHL